MDFRAFNLTAQGASHIKKNRECQDASKSYFCEDYGIAIVCDGHGGEDYIRSAIGSEKASSIALENIKEFIAHVDKCTLKRHFDELLHSLEASIISMWRNDVRAHWDANPITDEEKSRLSEKATRRYLVNNSISSAYGTTLIAVVVTKDYWFCFQVGDGKCVWVDKESKFDQLKLDEKCFLNATTSLCDSDALDHFQTHYSEDIPAAVFVGSDGIDDCFKNDEQLYNFYKTMSYSFGTTVTDNAVAELEDFLPRLSQKGSGDDVSVAAVLNMDLLPTIDAVVRFNRDDERAKKQKVEQEEAERNAALKAEYERKAAETKRKAEEEKQRREEELSRRQQLASRKQYADEETRIAKASQELDSARRLLDDARIKMDKAEESKNIALQRLGEETSDYPALSRVFNEKNEIYLKYYYNYQSLLGKFNQVQLVYNSVLRSCGARCPNPVCNEICPASAKFCSRCGADMSASPDSFVQQKPALKTNDESVNEPRVDACNKGFNNEVEDSTYNSKSQEPEQFEDDNNILDIEQENQKLSKTSAIILEDKDTLDTSDSSQEEKVQVKEPTDSADSALDGKPKSEQNNIPDNKEAVPIHNVSYTSFEQKIDGNSCTCTQNYVDIHTENGQVTSFNSAFLESTNTVDKT